MQYVSLRVEDLAACPCGDHAVLHLANAEGRPRARVRIAAEFARSLTAFDAGLVSGPAAAVVSLTDCMRAAGIEPSALVLWRDGEEVRVTLRVESRGAELDLTIEPGVGFIAARHLRLKILLARPSSTSESTTESPALEEQHHHAAEETHSPPVPAPIPTPIPEVYRPLLDSIRWDD